MVKVAYQTSYSTGSDRDEAWQRLHTASSIRSISFATATLCVPLRKASSGIASEKLELARSSAGLLLSLTDSSIIPQNVVRASSTRTTSHFWAQRSGNAQYMYFKVRVCFFP